MNTEGLNQRSLNSLPQHSGPPPIVEKDAITQETVVGSLANGVASVPEVASGSGEPISEPWSTTTGKTVFHAKYDIAPGSGDSELEQSAIDKPPVHTVLNAKEDGQDSTSSNLKIDSMSPTQASHSVGPAPERDTTDTLQAAMPDAHIASGIQGAHFGIPVATIDHDALAPAGAATAIAIPAFSNDEASSTGRTDSLDMLADARAFAQIAVSRSTAPPLAVGVFGSWGAGKSFFMDQVHDQVERLAAQSREQGSDSTSGKEFHSEVVQIRFNAWHYAETNLWASLVGHIFQELSAKTATSKRNEIFGRLSTARCLTIDASTALVQARKEQALAKKGLEEAKASLAKAKAKPVRTASLFTDLMVSAFEDTKSAEIAEARSQLQKAATALGVGSALTASQELTEEGAALLRNGLRAKEIFGAIAQNVGSPWRAAFYVFLAIAAPIVVVTILRVAIDIATINRDWLHEAFLSAVTLAAVLTGWFKKASGPVLLALEQLKSAKAKIEAHVQRNLEPLTKRIADNESELAKASANVEAASDELRATSARVAAVREELHGQSPAERLINFVRARAADGEYSKHLGLVSTIRKDFEELSSLVRGTAEKPTPTRELEGQALRARVFSIIKEACASKLLTRAEMRDLVSIAKRPKANSAPFDRIVLFIDDVDRCPPAKVVDVLQAIHMLLAFKLFVVFVGVDVRWVGSSLAQQYRGMLREPSGSDPLTSASDYLEKIFQIPYWVPVVTLDSSKKLLRTVLSARTLVEPGPVTSLSQQLERNLPKEATGALPVGLVTDQYEPAQLSNLEMDVVEAFAGVLDSPRKVIRFANVARWLKARDLLGSGDGNVYYPLLAQLAIATASPDLYSQWRLVLEHLASKSLGDVMLDMEEGYFSRNLVIGRTLKIVIDAGLGSMPLRRMIESDKWASRLSFSIPLNDVDGKLSALIGRHLEVGASDIPPFSEILAKPLSAH